MCLTVDSTNSSFKWRLQCTHCICGIVCIVLLWEGRNYWTVAGTLCVCVLNILYVVVYVVCVFECLLCERGCTLRGVWLWFWLRTISWWFYHLSFGTISFLDIFNHQSRLARNSPGEWVALSEVCWNQCCFIILIKARNLNHL